MTVLLITGTLAKSIVAAYASKSEVETEVLALPTQVASLMSPAYIASQLKRMDLSRFDVILVPGMIASDTSIITQQVGIRCLKGPKHAADIPIVLENLGKIEFSTVRPGCELLRDVARESAIRQLKSIYDAPDQPRRRTGSISIGAGAGKIWIGRHLPMRVLAEIVDAPTMSSNEIAERARHYVESGADIIDIGMTAGGGHSEEAKQGVTIAKAVVKVPVSIDTVEPDEIRAAIEAGADMVLSIDAGNMEEVSDYTREIPVVITPGTRTHSVSHNVRGRLAQLQDNIGKARHLGYRKIVADAVLSPLLSPNFTESLTAFYEFRKRNPNVPLLLGAGNVTELMDADSVGANLLLAGIAAEINANILLTTECSDKTQGCVSELSTAIKIAMLARHRSSPPKDVGLDLLVLKEKRRKEEPPISASGLRHFRARAAEGFIKDPAGSFKIWLDRSTMEMIAAHFEYGSATPDTVIRGSDPLGIVALAIEQGLISRLDHAAYVGSELESAKVALALKRSYVQDAELFEATALNRSRHETSP